MKKVFAILLVLAVVAGFAFAAETHTLKVKADVSEVNPAFTLIWGSYKTNSVITDVYGEKETYTTDTTATDTGLDLDKGGSITVTAAFINAAKTNDTYTLTFSDGIFTVNRAGVSGKLAPSSVVVSPNTTAPTGVRPVTDTTKAGLSGGGTISVANYTANDVTVSGSTAAVTVAFSGETATATATAPATLATATYNYTGDTKIDPNTSDNEWYYANIVLTVSTT